MHLFLLFSILFMRETESLTVNNCRVKGILVYPPDWKREISSTTTTTSTTTVTTTVTIPSTRTTKAPTPKTPTPLTPEYISSFSRTPSPSDSTPSDTASITTPTENVTEKGESGDCVIENCGTGKAYPFLFREFKLDFSGPEGKATSDCDCFSPTVEEWQLILILSLSLFLCSLLSLAVYLCGYRCLVPRRRVHEVHEARKRRRERKEAERAEKERLKEAKEEECEDNENVLLARSPGISNSGTAVNVDLKLTK